ncbi:MAG TPA: hypothetical protein VM077_06030 [Candidatus Limnocylindrales bacterium]|nr:hypothetical protein [Candidatus Limnocylindrales bacterium]
MNRTELRKNGELPLNPEFGNVARDVIVNTFQKVFSNADFRSTMFDLWEKEALDSRRTRISLPAGITFNVGNSGYKMAIVQKRRHHIDVDLTESYSVEMEMELTKTSKGQIDKPAIFNGSTSYLINEEGNITRYLDGNLALVDDSGEYFDDDVSERLPQTFSELYEFVDA